MVTTSFALTNKPLQGAAYLLNIFPNYKTHGWILTFSSSLHSYLLSPHILLLHSSLLTSHFSFLPPLFTLIFYLLTPSSLLTSHFLPPLFTLIFYLFTFFFFIPHFSPLTFICIYPFSPPPSYLQQP